MIYFWILFFLVFYTYLLYPLFLIILAKFYESPKDSSTNSNLKIDFVVLAYNEEKVILEKILNSLECLKKNNGAQLFLKTLYY